jgi:hypothetical protein
MSSRARRAISQPSGPLPRLISVIRPLKREGRQTLRIKGYIQPRLAQFGSPQDGLCPRLRGFAHAGKREGFRVGITSTGSERRSLSRFVQLETWRLRCRVCGAAVRDRGVREAISPSARLMTPRRELGDDLPIDSLPPLGREQGLEMLKWFRRRKEAAELARADADELLRTYGRSASNVARIFECDVELPDGTTHKGRTSEQWRRVALLIENMVPVRP